MKNRKIEKFVLDISRVYKKHGISIVCDNPSSKLKFDKLNAATLKCLVEADDSSILGDDDNPKNPKKKYKFYKPSEPEES